MLSYVQRVYNNIRYYYTGLNPSLFSAAIDVIVVEQPDGTYRSTPFQVCFSFFRCVSVSEEKLISIEINNEAVDLKMTLGEDCVAKFVGDEDHSGRLRSLGLRNGSNRAKFSVTTRIQGTTFCTCNIYLYKWTDRLVVSDIDGTITKSDVIGHIIPAFGGIYAHDSVASLLSKIKDNDYHLVYISSRAIGQANMTRSYLERVVQESIPLPDGPVLLNPTSILRAFRKEVIERRPEEFKIACLTELKSLFADHQPFFAGFGNRGSDIASYQAVGIPLENVFIVNSSGVVSRGDQGPVSTSYTSMSGENVNYFFPPLSLHQEQNCLFWSPPPALLTDEDTAALGCKSPTVSTWSLTRSASLQNSERKR